MEQENESLRKQLKDSNKKLSKYELNTPTSPQLHIIVSESGDTQPPTPLPTNDDHHDNDQKVKESDEEQQETQHQDDYDDDEPALDEPKPKPPPPKKEETDPFWLDIKDKVDGLDYTQIKKCVPNFNFIDEDDENWKMSLWTTKYGEYELHCTVSLVSYTTGKWSEDDTNLLFASVSKYGLNSKAAWDKIAENCNREVDDVMQKYSSLVSIPVKKLKKMSVARG